MTGNDMIRLILSNLVTHLPTMIVLVVGLAMALASWRRHPKASMWATLGFVIMLVTNLVMVVFYATVPHWASGRASIASIMAVVSVGFSMLFALSMSFVIAAVFADRGPRAP